MHNMFWFSGFLLSCCTLTQVFQSTAEIPRTSSPASMQAIQFETTPETLAKDTPEDVDAKFFRDEIEPILQESCYRCHGEKKKESDLRLDSRDAMLKGGKNGPAIVPGKPDESLLMKVLDYTGDIQMPPDAKLDDEKQQAFKKWIEKTAPWPKAKSDSSISVDD